MDGKQGFSLVILQLLFTSIQIAYTDSRRQINGEYIEDAFAEESLDDECYPSANSKWVLCRYRDDEKFFVENLDPCICTHILWLGGSKLSNIEKFKPLKNINKGLKIIISIKIEQSDIQNSSHIKTKVAQELSSYSFDGLDVRLGKLEPLINKTVSDFAILLKQLKMALGRRSLFLTVSKQHEGFLSHLLLKTTQSIIDAISFTPHPQELSGKNNVSQWIAGAVTQMNFPINKTLIALSLLPSNETTHKKAVTEFKTCSTNFFGVEAQQNSNETSFEVELLDYIENQTLELNKGNTAGIDVWVINEDDSNNLCKKGPFPLLEQISEVINPNQSPFEAFADLDIILSTSDSEISDEIQVLHELNSQPEEIEQYGCERVGFFRHPTDCKKFYQCAEYRSSKSSKINQYAVFVYKCPTGLVYDELQGSCNWPSWSDPCPGSDELLPVPPKTFTCKTPGFHSDPEDCRWFYYCSDLGDGELEAFEFQCPSHVLGFDEANMLCNWKWMVPTCGSSYENDKSIDYDLPNQELKFKYNSQLTDLQNANKISNRKNYSSATDLKTDNERNDLSKIIYQTPTRSHQENANKTVIDDFYVKAQNSVSDINLTVTSANKIKRESEIKEDIKPTLNKSEPFLDAKDQISNEPLSQIEKKHGTAFWHRSFINKDSDRDYNGWTRVHRPYTNNLNARQVVPQNSSLEELPSPLKINSQVSETETNPGVAQTQEKSRKGSVWKIIVEKEPISTRGFYHRSEIENLRNRNIHFHDTVKNVLTVNGILPNFNKNNLPANQNNSPLPRPDQRDVLPQHHQTVNSKVGGKTPFTNIRCLKLSTANSGKEPGRYHEIHKSGDFGCVSEIALTVQMGNSKDDDKYVLKDEQLSKSEEDSIDQSRSHQPIFSPWDRPADNARRIETPNHDPPNDTNFKQGSREQIQTSGRSIAFEEKKITLNVPFSTPHLFDNTNSNKELKKENEFIKRPIYSTEHFAAPLVSNNEKLEVESLVTQKNADRRDEKKSTNTSGKKETTDTHKSTEIEKEQSSSSSPVTNDFPTEDSKNEKMMPIHFYPQGVLISVDLSHLNEIPPLILIEVDRMLKTYMSGGDININLLKKRLNATTEGMEVPQHTTQNNDMKDITNMIHLIENMLNTSTEQPNNSSANSTDVNAFSTTARTDDNNVRKKELEYENVTEANQNNKNNASQTTESQEEIKKNKLANDKIVRNEEEENAALKTPFARRRLYRKYKYPSIREQIRKQNLHRYEINNNHYFPTVIKSYNLPNVPAVSIRNRYPSIAEQLRRQMIEITSNERPNNVENINIENVSNTGRNELSEEKDLQFGERIRITNPEITNQMHNRPHLSNAKPAPNFRQSESTINSPKVQADNIFRTTANEDIDFDDEIDDNYQINPARRPIINSIPQSQVPQSNLFYTLPLLPSNNVHQPRTNSYHERYSAERTHLPQEENAIRQRYKSPTLGRQQARNNEQPPKRRRKLRILVKKRVDPNTFDNTGATYPDSSSRARHSPPTRLPDNLLKVLKRKLKQRMNIDSENDVALQIQFQDYVWNVPFVNNYTDTAFSATACTRPGLFQHPTDCNMFYECFWDQWLQKFTLHVFSCPVRLIYDDNVRGCSHPSIQSHCTDAVRQ